MGYIEKILGDSERVIYRTHMHGVVLVERTIGWFFAFLVFLGIGLAALLWPNESQGEKVRWWLGLIALVSLLVPLYLVITPWRRGERGRALLGKVWRPMLVGLLILVVALLGMLGSKQPYIGWIVLALALIPLAELIRRILDYANERYIITSRRVMEVRGIINKHVRDSALEKVNDVDLTQSVFGRLFRYGTVQIITGSDIGVNLFRRISNPVRFKRAMLNAKEELHQIAPAVVQDEIVARQPATAAATAALALDEDVPANIPDLIAELAQLRQQGILSEEEFQAKKTELLKRL